RCCAAWGGGMFRLAQPMPADTPVVVRLVQPNAAQHLKWRPDMVPVFFERLMDATARPADPAPDIVIWPETSVPYLLNHADDVMGMMADAAGGGPVMFGAQRRDRQGVYNSLAVIDAQGRVSHLYDKHHLVPFGEYLPFGGVLGAIGLKGLAARDAYGYTPGPGPRLLDLGPAGRVVPLICYEAVFPEDLRAPGGRPDWVVQITNDAWFGRLTGPYQHLAQARLRAVERGLPLVRVANTGVSAVIDARGRVLDSLPLNTAGALDAGLPGALPPTPYARGGDWPAVFAFFLLFALFAAARRQK
ncbi:apolipoprotein N-acyltransferase, partial [Rhodovulum imhoffii]|uniref:apolipoprotein N-acyltransferase n=1 Tax=Rhodovulum imhoffii TaxID=365340 RepID=UPI001913C3B6